MTEVSSDQRVEERTHAGHAGYKQVRKKKRCYLYSSRSLMFQARIHGRRERIYPDIALQIGSEKVAEVVVIGEGQKDKQRYQHRNSRVLHSEG